MRLYKIMPIVVLSLSLALIGACKPNTQTAQDASNDVKEDSNVLPKDAEAKKPDNSKDEKAEKPEDTPKKTDENNDSTPEMKPEPKQVPETKTEDENKSDEESKKANIKPGTTIDKFENGNIVGIKTIEDLDKASVFSFAIMSDNKGDGPDAKPEFKKMVDWIKEGDDKFVIGLGDHVKNGWRNDFLGFVKKNKFWFDNFYANVADGENEFYGNGQGHWGAGRKILDVNKMSEKEHVKIRENGCEYYAKIKVGDYTVHLIQLHYADTPADDSKAFTKDTKQYLVDTLNSIEKGDKDIVIAAAHSRTGFFYKQLDEKERKVIYDKCDLVLSATTHMFARLKIDEYGDKGPLYLNTGSITYPNGFCPPGYIEVHVLENPLSLVVQYYNAKKEKREFQQPFYAWIKKVGGEIIATNFRKPSKSEDMGRVICKIDRDYSKEELDKIAEKIYLDATKADFANIAAYGELKKGEVKYFNLFDVFKYNNEIYALTMTKDQIEKLFMGKLDTGGKDEMTIAINSYDGEWIIKNYKLADDKVLKTGIKEVEALEKWLLKEIEQGEKK